MVCGPDAPNTSVTEQLVLVPEPDSVHGEPPMVTSPVGADCVPASISVTVAVAVTLSFTTTGFLLSVTFVLVCRGFTPSATLAWLGACTEFPANAAAMVCGPDAPNESVTEQLAPGPEPASVQLEAPMLTVPAGVNAGAVSMSVTVAVAVRDSLIATGFLLNTSCIDVFRGLILNESVALAIWVWHAVMLTRQLESVALNEMVTLPDAGGMPDSTPAGESASHAGSDTGAKLTAPSPPEVPNLKLTGTLTVPSGTVAGRMSSGSPTRIDSVWVAVCWAGGEAGGASTTCTVKENPLGAALTGEPEIRPRARLGDTTPASVASCRPSPSVAGDQVRFVLVPIFPPTAVIAAEYGWPVMPSGRAVVTTVNVTAGVVMPLAASVVPTACAPPTVVKLVPDVPEVGETAETSDSAMRAKELASRIGEWGDWPPAENTRTVTCASSPGARATVAFEISALLISALVRLAPVVRNAGSTMFAITWFWNWLIRVHPPLIDATGVRYCL